MTQLKSLPKILFSTAALVALIATTANAKIYQGTSCYNGVCSLQARRALPAPPISYDVAPTVYIYGSSVPVRQSYKCATPVPDAALMRELRLEMELESQRIARLTVKLESMIRQADYFNRCGSEFRSTRYAKTALRDLSGDFLVLQKGITAIDTLLAGQTAVPVITAPSSSIPIESTPAPGYSPTVPSVGVPSASELGVLPGAVIDPSQLESTVVAPPANSSSTIPQSGTIIGPPIDGPAIQAPVPNGTYQTPPVPQLPPVPPTGTEYERSPFRLPPANRPALPQEDEMRIPDPLPGSGSRNISLPLSNRGY